MCTYILLTQNPVLIIDLSTINPDITAANDNLGIDSRKFLFKYIKIGIDAINALLKIKSDAIGLDGISPIF